MRIGGANAVAEAVNLALRQHPKWADTVAPGGIAWSQEFAVLAASPLASADHAPIILGA